MTTKTLTIAEDAYDLLLAKKREDESFSQELRRLLSGTRKRSLSDFFGIISEAQGASMLSTLEKIKKANKKLVRL
ncbi:antitoxin VapB family protein [Candidatus Woesearchaeota archaeon]|nr:antitoxin VapB family protein [Candidatus Woesearchaeota archaeon]